MGQYCMKKKQFLTDADIKKFDCRHKEPRKHRIKMLHSGKPAFVTSYRVCFHLKTVEDEKWTGQKNSKPTGQLF